MKDRGRDRVVAAARDLASALAHYSQAMIEFVPTYLASRVNQSRLRVRRTARAGLGRNKVCWAVGGCNSCRFASADRR